MGVGGREGEGSVGGSSRRHDTGVSGAAAAAGAAQAAGTGSGKQRGNNGSSRSMQRKQQLLPTRFPSCCHPSRPRPRGHLLLLAQRARRTKRSFWPWLLTLALVACAWFKLVTLSR